MTSKSLSMTLTPEAGLSRYLAEIRKFPMLEKDEEFMAAVHPDWTGDIPISLVYDADGHLRHWWTGRASYETFVARVQDVLG